MMLLLCMFLHSVQLILQVITIHSIGQFQLQSLELSLNAFRSMADQGYWEP